MKKNRINSASRMTALIILSACAWATPLSGEETSATKMLKARSVELREDVITVTEGVYVAVGYSPANVSMLVGTNGVVIVDTGMTVGHAERILAEFRRITNKPVKAIIYTHGHGDHTNGASVFVAQGKPDIWARSNLNAEADTLTGAGLTVQNVRAVRQAGFKLPPDKRINNGIAPAMWPKRQGEVFASSGSGFVPPNRTFDEPRKTVTIAGIDIVLVAAPGETSDQLYVWLPGKKVILSGDNFYQSWPNLYAIRGTPYRDVRDWADSVGKMLKENAEYLIPGHTRPILGKEKVTEALANYRDAIRFVFDKTIEGMNKGLTPDELVEYVELSPQWAEKDYLGEYYGNVEWAVRSIFNGYLGWFDGNPTNLFPLSPGEEARRMADLVGGEDALRKRAEQAVAEGDYQWAAQLADHLIALNPDASAPKTIKAVAFEALAARLLTTTGRNYYLTVAQELRNGRTDSPKQ